MAVNNSDKLMLSILICSIPERESMLNGLLKQLRKQIKECNEIHPTLGDVEIVSSCSKRFLEGGLSIGENRQALLKLAKGNYVCYLDDDEHISPDYVETILRLCYEDKDLCTFRSIAMLSNNWAIVDMSLKNIVNQQINPERITYRKPWHVCAVRRDIAIKYRFPNSNYGEDWNWFEQVLRECKTEAHTRKIIHNYNHGAHSEADKIK